MVILSPQPGLVRPLSAMEVTDREFGAGLSPERQTAAAAAKSGEGGACATLTPGAPDDSSVARWTLSHAPTHTNIPMHAHLDTNTYCTHIHN